LRRAPSLLSLIYCHLLPLLPRGGKGDQWGNTFKTTLNALYSNHRMASDNLSDELRSRGLNAANQRVKIFDESASLGGPVVRDRIWFFGAFRTWRMAKQFAGVYWNKTQHESLTPPGAPLRVVPYTPWVDRPLDVNSGRWESYDSKSGRVTWQAASASPLVLFRSTPAAAVCRTDTCKSGSQPIGHALLLRSSPAPCGPATVRMTQSDIRLRACSDAIQ
jgi:hypothetical protein